MVPSARCAALSSAFSKRIEIDRLTNKNELRRVKVLRTEWLPRAVSPRFRAIRSGTSFEQVGAGVELYF